MDTMEFNHIGGYIMPMSNQTLLLIGVVCLFCFQCGETTPPPQGQLAGTILNKTVKLDGTWKINHDMAEQHPGPAQYPEMQIDASKIPKVKVTTVTIECELENLTSDPINNPQFQISLDKPTQPNAKLQAIHVPKIVPEKGKITFKKHIYISKGHVDFEKVRLYDEEKIEKK